MSGKYDWQQWENYYVQGTDDMTLERLSEMPGAPSFNTVRKRAADLEWTAKRRAYRDKAAARALERALESSSSNMAEIVGEYFRQTESLRSIAALGINQNIDAIREGRVKLTLTQTLAVVKLTSEVDSRMFGMVRDNDARVNLLYDLFIDVIEEVVEDPEKRKQAVRRMALALESTRL